MKLNNKLKEGFYWILLHPIFEEGWNVGYYTGKGWYLHNIEGLQGWDIIDEIGDNIKPPPEKINYT